MLLQQKNRLSLKEEQHYSISAGKGINFVLQVTTFNKINVHKFGAFNTFIKRPSNLLIYLSLGIWEEPVQYTYKLITAIRSIRKKNIQGK